MRNIILFFICIGFGSVYSQNQYFIKPVFNKKIHITSMDLPMHMLTHGHYFRTYSVNNPYIAFRSQTFSQMPTYNIGMGVGASFLNKKHILSAEFAQDEIGSMSTYSFMSKSVSPFEESVSYYESIGIVQAVDLTYRLSLDYSLRLTKEEKLIPFYIKTHLNFLKSSGDVYYTDYYEYEEPIELLGTEASLVGDYFSMIYWSGFSFLLGGGFSTDLKLKFKKKTVYLFSFELDYRQGFRQVENSNYHFKIRENDEDFNLIFRTMNRGSGIYFQISRKIQIHPWRPNKKIKEVA